MTHRKHVITIASLITSIILLLTGCIFTTTQSNTNACADENTQASKQSSNTEYGIIGAGDALIKSGEKYDFLDNVLPLPKEDDWHDGEEFRVIVTNVDSENGASYHYKAGETYFIPDKNDDGKTYTVHYELQKKTTS